MTDAVVQAKAYINSPQNALLVENRNFGKRKYIHVGMNRQFSLGKNKPAGVGNKNWVHPPEALLRGHIVYNVKFLGHVEVDSPKGSDMVKDAIRKMKFSKQIKKSEGLKTPKVELTIAVDGVTVQEPKLKVIQYQYPLHRISYCADDKSDKRMFTFIGKEADGNKHHCFVFDSEKCAEEITLTIGQAFDLAYRKFMESSTKDLDMKKQYLMMQKKVQQLTQENLELKARVADLERMLDPSVIENIDKHNIQQAAPAVQHTPGAGGEPTVGRKLENLILDDDDLYSTPIKAPQTNGLSSNPNTPVPALAPPPPVPARAYHSVSSPPPPQTPTQNANSQEVDLFGATPFNQVASPTSATLLQAPLTSPSQHQPLHTSSNPFAKPSSDPFGMGSFGGSADDEPTAQELETQIRNVDKELMDLQAGFSQGLSLGTDDFSLADLDPLNKK